MSASPSERRALRRLLCPRFPLRHVSSLRPQARSRLRLGRRLRLGGARHLPQARPQMTHLMQAHPQMVTMAGPSASYRVLSLEPSSRCCSTSPTSACAACTAVAAAAASRALRSYRMCSSPCRLCDATEGLVPPHGLENLFMKSTNLKFIQCISRPASVTAGVS